MTAEQKNGTHACLLKVNLAEDALTAKYVYFIMATDGSGEPHVQAFSSMRTGLDHFEIAYRKAHEAGYGRSAGAMFNHMALQPRIFHYGEISSLKELLGETVYATIITKLPAVPRQLAFKCLDQERAAKLYEEATAPKITG